MMTRKLKYFLTCASKSGARKRFFCPSCGSAKSSIVSRKYLVTTLRRCVQCELLFRAPTTTEAENASFYQETYREGFTTDTPSDSDLKNLLASNFVGHEKDYTRYIDILTALGGQRGDRLLDFGCSWGYGSWQLRRDGFEVLGYEISKPRCRYAREKLKLCACDSIDSLADQSFDIFFSAHVLEHVPAVSEIFALAGRKLKKGGLFLAFTPNGSHDRRLRQPATWNQMWGMVHPNLLDDRFLGRAFPNVMLATDPYDLGKIRTAWSKGNVGNIVRMDGAELMAAVRLP